MLIICRQLAEGHKSAGNRVIVHKDGPCDDMVEAAGPGVSGRRLGAARKEGVEGATEGSKG